MTRGFDAPMKAMKAQRPIELTLPADSQMLLIIRLITAGVTARVGLTVDAVEDVKMAVEEACNCFLRCACCDSLRLSFTASEGVLRVRVEGIDSAAKSEFTPPGDCDEVQVIRYILESMVDDAHIIYDGKALSAIEMAKSLGA
jgi:anti-sigma regulatory factor (Ser/Thr protein kinase)